MSSFGTLDWYDLAKGLIVSVLTTVLGGIYAVVQTGSFPTIPEWRSIGLAGIGALLAYLIKNLFSGPKPA